MIIILIWLVTLILASVSIPWYIRRYRRPDLAIAIYVIYLAMSQIIATKIAAFDLGFKTFYAPAAVLIFPFTFQINDIVNEAFGRFEVHRMIFIAFVTQVIMTFFLWLGDVITPASFWIHQEAWHHIVGLVPRITLASWIAFLISENLDALLYTRLRELTKGKFLWVRNVFSDIPSLAVDSFIFITLAFYKVAPLWPLIVGQIVLKWLVAIIDTPLMYVSRWILYYTPHKCRSPLDDQ